ncbi:MAG: cupin domain-containing protein [Alphaproteobacteria bacterium]|nr:cupin domain-containing protein [Alphaproteobacteria bacterium]
MISTKMKTSQENAPKVGALIRSRRRQQKMTLQNLGEASGVSVGYLSQVERDQATPSLGTLAQISRALDVGVEYFIATPSAQSAYTRNDHRNKFSIDGSSVIYEQISTEFPGNILSSFMLTIPVGYHSETVSHEGEEIVFILEGRITQRIDNTNIVMAAGDSMHFRGNRPHSWWNDSDKPAKILWTGNMQLFHAQENRNKTS